MALARRVVILKFHWRGARAGPRRAKDFEPWYYGPSVRLTADSPSSSLGSDELFEIANGVGRVALNAHFFA